VAAGAELSSTALDCVSHAVLLLVQQGEVTGSAIMLVYAKTLGE
jgi:hypothetical protein